MYNERGEMAPVDVTLSEKHSNRFQLINYSKLESAIPVYKYKCLRTGITVVFGDIEGPLVQGYFTLATEAHDGDGIPHTLEHLIFLGSEDYPFKGVLDLLANRCLASGTNAWTDVDHTCYTISTAGSEGFLSLLPVYLDHILYPTIKECGFVTEVHHITYEAEDAGVVYCEMQGRENTGESIVSRNMLENLYPGNCGYKSETGGIMKNLRESTTNDKIRKYHHAFYRPENLLLLISGKIDHSSVFDVLEPFIQKILSKGNRGDYVRPWQNPVDPLTISSNNAVLFPSDEETNGIISVGFRGPNCLKDYIGCQLLLKYLTDTPISPLPKEMVEIEDPFCTDVSFDMTSHNEPSITINFENVPIEKMEAEIIPSKLDEVLYKLLVDDGYLDLTRLRTFIKRNQLHILSYLDNYPHEKLSSIIIEDFLYGKTSADLEQKLNKMSILKQLDNEEIIFWKGILEKYFINGNRVIVRGIPSIKKQEELANEEKERVQERQKTLGEEGLKKKAVELLNAKVECETKPPKDLLTSLKIPNIECIQFYSFKTFSTNSINQHDLFKITNAPIYMEVDNIKSNFVYMYTFINTKDLPMNLRMYLPIMVDLLMKSTVICDGIKIHHTDIIAELEKDIMCWNSEIGTSSSSHFLCGTFSSVISLFFQLEPEKYDKGIKWLHNFLFNTEITKEKFSINLTKIINEVSSYRRDGNHMLRDILRNVIYNNNSNHYACSTLRQHKFLSNLQNKIESDEGWSSVTDDLNNVKMILANPDSIKMHLSADLDKLCEIKPDASALLEKLLPPNVKYSAKPFETVFDYEYILPNNQCTIRACAVGMGAIESSYFIQVVDCINDFNHPDMPALLVFLQYFTQLEGPMWKNIRGLGHAYSYSITPRPNEGLLLLHFYRSVNVPAAYKETKNIMESHLSSDAVWDMTLFESAKCSIVFEIAEREKSIGDLITQSVLFHFRNLSPDYNRNLIKRISEVTLDDLPLIGNKYVMPLFNPTCTRTAMVCPPSKLDDVASEFKKMDIDMTIYKSLEDSILNDAA
uniref:Presequence protease, mitochondrial n=1 Tax=Schizaphis graminum TaxID=13262 RepID=A0A2S2PA73_SCHGA